MAKGADARRNRTRWPIKPDDLEAHVGGEFLSFVQNAIVGDPGPENTLEAPRPFRTVGLQLVKISFAGDRQPVRQSPVLSDEPSLLDAEAELQIVAVTEGGSGGGIFRRFVRAGSEANGLAARAPGIGKDRPVKRPLPRAGRRFQHR